MKRALFFFIFFIGYTAINAQAVLDTANVAYRNTVATYFEEVTLRGEAKIDLIKDRKARKEFLSAYQDKQEDFRRLIKKGIFIEHPKYTPLIQAVYEKIKKANPSTNFDDTRLFLGISDEYNAYNYGNGIVVLNLPLLLEMDNEFELAYVISHEISHQKLEHVYNSMLKKAVESNSDAIKKQTALIEREKYNKSRLAENLFKKLVYGNKEESRKCEHQADSLGYIFFRNAYPGKEYQAIETLKKLKEIDNQDNDSLVKKDFVAFFEVNQLKFKDEWITSEIAAYNYQKQKNWNIDSLRTHPDCDLRISFLKNAFDIKEPTDKTAPKIQKQAVADYEYVFGLYHLEEYGKSLYFTLLKLKTNPNDVFLRKMLYHNLVKINDARNKLILNKYLEVERPEFKDDYNQLLCLVRNIRKNELSQIIEFYKP